MLIIQTISLTSYYPLLKVDNFAQAIIAQKHIRNLGFKQINIVSGGNYNNINVPHFNEYTWD